MAQANGTVELPRLSRQATILPKTLNDEARTVDVVWTTGARVLRGYFEQYWEELSLDPKHVDLRRLNNGAPMLNAHYAGGADSVIGTVVPGSASVDGKRGIATVRFAKAEDDPVADQIFRKIKDGIVNNLSVGYATTRMEKVSDGGTDKIPVYRATKWQPMELSPVPIGADDGAGYRSESAERFTCEFVTPEPLITRAATETKTKTETVVRQKTTQITRQQQERKTMADEDNPNTETPSGQGSESPAVAATRAAERARQEEAAAQSEAAKNAAQDAIARERKRSVEIRKIASQSKLGEAWAMTLIDAGTSVEEARKAAFEHLTTDGDKTFIDPSVRIGAGDDERDKYVRGASAWLIERTGKRKLLEQAKSREPDLFPGIEFGGGGAFRGLSPLEIARDTLERQGVKTRGMDKMRMLGMAFTYRSGPFQTTSDFANILENVLHKMLLGAYATQDTTWQRFCGTDDVPDFRSSNRYRTGSLPSLPKILEHGEYTTGAIPDAAKYAISTERHGEIFALSREAIVNDDMGALANLAMEFGRAAARTIENDVYALLALNSGLGPTMSDSNPFYHSSRGNVGTGAAISVASIDADRVLMRAQKDPSGRDYLMLTPTKLVVPDALQGTAAVINRSEYDPDTANKLQRRNMVFNLFDDIIGTPRLSATSTRRYTFCDPQIAAAFTVAFLEGYGRGPIMESQAGWRIDGVEWKVTQYAKAQAADPKASVTNAGV